jgi:hypothetical protein
MKDIVFYYIQKDELLINELLFKYPHAIFRKLTGSVVDLAKEVLPNIKTSAFWLIDITLLNWEQNLFYKIPDWDTQYVHMFSGKDASMYLIPTLAELTTSTTEFVDKKIIKCNDIKFPDYDIFFIRYDENNADKNLELLKHRYLNVKVISNVDGIFNAHLAAAQQSDTDFFWVVDADATVIDAFDFDYRVPEWDFDVVHIWSSINPINLLEYGYGGVKLIPRHLILNADETTAVDVTTSIGANIKVMREVSNINNFATSPLNAWRSAFRECVKLTSGSIARHNVEETAQRLETWISKGGHRPLGEYVRGGASAGAWYGNEYRGNKEKLAKINDYTWLAHEFDAHVKMFPPETFKD